MRTDLIQTLSSEGAIRRADHPELARPCDAAVAKGELVAILPGIYVAPAAMDDLFTRVTAVCLADPDAVIVGRAALALHEDRTYRGPIDVASGRLHSRRWLRVQRRTLPPELVAQGPVNVACRALTALDLAVDTGGETIDDALRAGITLEELHAVHAQVTNRRGRREVARLLEESRDEPWSPAERRAHVLLRGAGIAGWTANRPVKDRTGKVFAFGDIVFDEAALIVEIDGDDWHLSPGQVLRDRARDQRLTELAWTVVRYSASQVMDDPEAFVASVRAAVVAHSAWRSAA